jgi:hypothetical protein
MSHKLNLQPWMRSLSFHLLVPGLFVAFALCLMPVKQAFQLDLDEGLELIKASLYSEGFTLYTQIWNDQPPLLTVLLSSWFALFGKSIFAARCLILGFAALLIGFFFQTLRITLGNLPAIVGTLLLSVSCNFLRLSVSVMFGLPSLALAMLSIYTLILYQQKPRFYLAILSGIFIGLSLQIKLFTVIFIPLLMYLLIEVALKKWQEKGKVELIFYFSHTLLWLVSLFTSFTLVGILLNSLNFEQLLQSNLGHNVKDAFQKQNNFVIILTLFLQDFDYVLLAITGIIALFKGKESYNKFPLIWLITVTGVLLNYKPIWYHYYPLLSLPLTWLATYGATLAFKHFQKKNWYEDFKLQNLKKLTLTGFAAAFFIVSLVAIPLKLTILQVEIANNFGINNFKNTQVIKHILKYKQSTEWLFTDLPIYGFYTGLKIPPEIAVLSKKRLKSGNLTVNQVHSLFKKYRPEQVVLGRFPKLHSQVRTDLKENYSKTYDDGIIAHYVLKKYEQ